MFPIWQHDEMHEGWHSLNEAGDDRAPHGPVILAFANNIKLLMSTRMVDSAVWSITFVYSIPAVTDVSSRKKEREIMCTRPVLNCQGIRFRVPRTQDLITSFAYY